jgi:hypothetical protein
MITYFYNLDYQKKFPVPCPFLSFFPIYKVNCLKGPRCFHGVQKDPLKKLEEMFGMGKLLINENPLLIIPSLAVRLGVNEAVVLQQIHYWVMKSKHVKEGRQWIYNTYQDWQKQLPFWSESTVKRTIRSLEKQGYLLSDNWNKLKLDKTKWYTIDYEKIKWLKEQSIAQSEPSKASGWNLEQAVLNRTIPEITT